MYNKLFIYGIILLVLIIIYCVLKLSLGTKFIKRDLVSEYLHPGDTLKGRLKRFFTIFKKQTLNFIMKWRKKYSVFYPQDELEEARRDAVLERYYIDDVTKHIPFREFDAQNIVLFLICSIIGILLSIFVKPFIGPIIIVISFLYFLFLRFHIIDSLVNAQNMRLESVFGEFFLTQYRILLYNHKKPLERGLNVYKKICNNWDLEQFINIALYMISTVGEEETLNKLNEWYAEVPSLSKLLNIEKQVFRGSNVEGELLGMKKIIMGDKEDKIIEKCDKMEKESNIIVYAIIFVTIQASLALGAYVMMKSGVFH